MLEGMTGPTGPARMRVRLFVGGFVALSLAGHVMTLYKRPSSTTSMDFALYALFVIPVIAAIARTGHRDARFLLCLTPLLVLSVTGRYWNFPAKYPVEAYASARDVIQEVQAYVRDSGRPAVLFAPSSHHLGQVIEQLVLIQGRLGRTALAPGSLRERVLPRSELLGASADELARLQDRIAQGWLIIWAHQDPLAPTEIPSHPAPPAGRPARHGPLVGPSSDWSPHHDLRRLPGTVIAKTVETGGTLPASEHMERAEHHQPATGGPLLMRRRPRSRPERPPTC
jgi:hypothetical protein